MALPNMWLLPSCNGNHVFMVDHGYPWLFHGHVFIFHTHGQKCNHSATKTWLTIVIIMVITSFPMVIHSSLKKEYNGSPHKKISEILPLHSGNIVVLSNK